MHQGRPERPRRYCTNCGAQASQDDAFCAGCGARLPSGRADEAATREIPRPAQGGGMRLGVDRAVVRTLSAIGQRGATDFDGGVSAEGWCWCLRRA